MERKRIVQLLAVVGTMLCASANAAPVNYPTRPITILDGSAPGGTLDVIARVLAQHFEKAWGQSVTVEPRLGAGNIVAAAAVAKAPPNGYMISMGGAPNAALFVKDLAFDPLKDTTPISVVGISNYFLTVTSATKIKTIREFIAAAKANPGKFNFGIVPSGAHQLETDEMQNALGVRINPIPYKGIAPIYAALLVREIDGTMSTSVSQLKTGEFVALAVAGEKRMAEYPEVPTFRESGFKYDPQANYTLFAPGATPREVLDKIAAETAVAAKSPEFMARVTKIFAIDGVGSTHDWAVDYIKQDYDRLKRAADRAGLKPQ